MKILEMVQRILSEVLCKKHKIINRIILNSKLITIERILQELPISKNDEKLVDQLMNDATKNLKFKPIK